jgi:hypothetical protein
MERSESGITMRGKTGDAMDRPGWRSSFLGDPGAIFLCGKLGRGTKKEKSSKKERTEGLWKLTLLMEIRKGRGFPQPLEKSLAKDARPFHSSHRPNNKDLFTIIYCRHDQKPWNGMCANSKLSQQRGSPQKCEPITGPSLDKDHREALFTVGEDTPGSLGARGSRGTFKLNSGPIEAQF